MPGLRRLLPALPVLLLLVCACASDEPAPEAKPDPDILVLDDPTARREAVKAALDRLARPGDTAALPALERTALRGDPELADQAMTVMEAIEGEAAKASLAAVLKAARERADKEKSALKAAEAKALVISAAERLAYMGDPRFESVVAGYLRDAQETIRYTAAVALRAFDTPTSRAALLEVFLHDQDNLPRCGAYQSLDMLGDPEFRKVAAREAAEYGGRHPCAAD